MTEGYCPYELMRAYGSQTSHPLSAKHVFISKRFKEIIVKNYIYNSCCSTNYAYLFKW